MGYCARCGSPLRDGEYEGKPRPVCSACGLVVFQDPKLAVAVLIGRERRVLLQRRAIDPGLGRWSFPSGYVDRGEVVEEAARREVREELGVEVRLERLLGLYSDRGNPVVLAVYLGRISAGQPTAACREVECVGWFGGDELPELAFPHDREIIADWLAGEPVSPIARVRGGRQHETD